MGTVAERKEPRFATTTSVVFQADGRQDVQEFWTANISKGGLFVVTRTPPPLGTHVEVTLQTPDGSLTLSSEVVHVLTPEVADQMWQPPGVGLQFRDVTDAQRQALKRYVDGVASALEAGQDTAGAARLAEAMDAARTLLGGLDSGDIYKALGKPGQTPPAELKQRVEELQVIFTAGSAAANPAQQARLQSAQRALERVRARVQQMSEPPPETAAPPSKTPTRDLPDAKDVRAKLAASRDAKQHADAARQHLERQDFTAAEAAFELAIQLDGAVAAYQVGHAWAVAVNPKRPQAERLLMAQDALRKLATRYKLADVHYTLGMVLHLSGKDRDAEESMRTALSLDKDHHGAQRMARLFESRRQKAAPADKGGGFLSKLRLR